jgi:hypothetical protein
MSKPRPRWTKNKVTRELKDLELYIYNTIKYNKDIKADHKPKYPTLIDFCQSRKPPYHSHSIWEWEQAKYISNPTKKKIKELKLLIKEAAQYVLINTGLDSTYPTFNIFMLKSQHGFVDAQQSNVKHSGSVKIVDNVPRPKGEGAKKAQKRIVNAK